MTKPKTKPTDTALETQEAFYRSLLARKADEIRASHDRRVDDFMVLQLHNLADQIHNQTVQQAQAALNHGYTSENLPTSVPVQFEVERRIRAFASTLVPAKG